MSTPSNTPPPAPLFPGVRLRVLVVDDEPTIRTVARLMLERAGYAVEEAGDGTAAVARVRAGGEPFAAILLDVTLPDRSGLDVLPDLRSASPRSAVVLTSGKAEEDVPGHGADGYLPKPFSKEQLLTAVRTVLAGART